MTTPSGAASASIVNGLASNPHATVAATVMSQAGLSESNQRTVADAAASHITVVVLSDR
jgi:hypothetical protein